MNKKSIFVAMLTLVLVFGLAFVSCDNGGGSNNDGGDDTPGGNTPGGENPGSSVPSIQGMYIADNGFSYITFTGSNFTVYAFGMPFLSGTFTISGSTLRLAITFAADFSQHNAGDVVNMTIINANTIYDADEGYLRKS
jgi:hypothetical protein